MNIRNEKGSILILYSGEDAGYLETCGCSEGQLGGIARRHTIIKERQNRSTVLLLHNGDLVTSSGLQQEIKYQVFTNALMEMEYDVVNVGEGELLLGIDLILQEVYSERLISANLFRNGETVFKPFIVRKYVLDGLKVDIGVVGVISQEFASQIKESVPELVIEAPSEALARVLEEIKAQDVQLIILLAHCGIEEAKSLAKQFPSLDIVISGHGMAEGLDQPVFMGNTMILNPGMKGKKVGELELLIDHSGKIVEKRHKLIPVRDTIERSTDILPLLHLYRMMLKDYDLLHEVEKRLTSENIFVGSETCQRSSQPNLEIEDVALLPILQHQSPKCGPRSLLAVCELLGIKAELDELCQLSGLSEDGTTKAGLYRAAQKKGLEAKGAKVSLPQKKLLLAQSKIR